MFTHFRTCKLKAHLSFLFHFTLAVPPADPPPLLFGSFVAILPKVEEVFKNFHYVPYSSLTLASWVKAAHGEEDLVLNAQGGFTSKSLDRQNEISISVVEWHTAARAAEE